MIRSRLFWQLFGGYVVVVGVFAAIVGFAVSDWLTDDSIDEIGAALRSDSVLLREVARSVLRSGGRDQLRGRIRQLGEETGRRLTVVLADGTVIADSSVEASQMDNHRARPEIRAALRNGEGAATRFSKTLQLDMMYFALAWRDAPAGEVVGCVRAAISSRIIDKRLAKIRGLVLLGAGSAALVALLLGGFFVRRLTSRVAAVTTMARAVSAGDYSRRVLIQDGDEISELAMAYNDMAEKMQERIDTILEDRNTVQGILSSMVEGVVAVDREEVVLQMNAVAGRILGVSPSEVLGKRIWETARVNEIARSLGASLGGKRVYRTQSRILQGEEEVLLDINASPILDSEGVLSGAVVVFHDITEMRRLESVRREFVINASHELKTPITAIRGFLDTLVEDTEVPAEVRQKFLRRASVQAERLAGLVMDLLRLSRLESGATEATERLDLRDVVRRSVRGLAHVSANKQIRVELIVGDTGVFVLADPATIGLVVDNLVDNAVKYTPAGGTVKVRVQEQDGEAVVEVIDDGIGIGPEHQDRIFERFYRVDKARSREVGGTGLGLAIAKHAIGTLGGELSLESELGRGSVFRVRLPLA